MRYTPPYSVKSQGRRSMDWQLLSEEGLMVGEEADALKSRLDRYIEHYFIPFSREFADPNRKFQILRQEWGAQTAHLSSITEIAMHPAYQQIIGMGEEAIPFILKELRKKTAHWFWALKSITGEDPVPSNQRGRMDQMRDAWLRWGNEQGYL
jgi:hypothetical protein